MTNAELEWREMDLGWRRDVLLTLFNNPDWYTGDITWVREKDERLGESIIDKWSSLCQVDWPFAEDGWPEVWRYPLFQDISDRFDAPVIEIKRYYAAYLGSILHWPNQYVHGFFKAIAEHENNPNGFAEIINYVPRMQLLR